jgi:uncharacterized protein YoxC
VTEIGWITIAVWALVGIAFMALLMFGLLLRKAAKAIDNLNKTIESVNVAIPLLVEQSQQTLESVELTALQTRELVSNLQIPVSRFNSISSGAMSVVSPQLVTIITGLIKGYKLVSSLFCKKG